MSVSTRAVVVQLVKKETHVLDDPVAPLATDDAVDIAEHLLTTREGVFD